jgi:hypothetical protein
MVRRDSDDASIDLLGRLELACLMIQNGSRGGFGDRGNGRYEGHIATGPPCMPDRCHAVFANITR